MNGKNHAVQKLMKPVVWLGEGRSNLMFIDKVIENSCVAWGGKEGNIPFCLQLLRKAFLTELH